MHLYHASIRKKKMGQQPLNPNFIYIYIYIYITFFCNCIYITFSITQYIRKQYIIHCIKHTMLNMSSLQKAYVNQLAPLRNVAMHLRC